jgi:integrase
MTRGRSKRAPEVAVSRSPRGARLRSLRITQAFHEALERAGLRRITFHELRHTFGTQIYVHNAPDATNGAAFVERAFGARDAVRLERSWS